MEKFSFEQAREEAEKIREKAKIDEIKFDIINSSSENSLQKAKTNIKNNQRHIYNVFNYKRNRPP